MKNIFLIGDSIRHGSEAYCSPGYGVFVRDGLKGRANVYMPKENCRFAQHTLRGIRDWAWEIRDVAPIMDVVHFNCGIWDIMPTKNGEPLTPVEFYVYLLERIYKEIRILFPKARIVFALTTALLEKGGPVEKDGYNQRIEQYNAAARERLEPLGVEINDLYSLSSEFDVTYYANGDWVHQNDKGAQILADAVMQSIMK